MIIVIDAENLTKIFGNLTAAAVAHRFSDGLPHDDEIGILHMASFYAYGNGSYLMRAL